MRTQHEDIDVAAISGSTVPDTHGHGTEVLGVLAAQQNNSEGLAGVTAGAQLTALQIDTVQCPNDGDTLSLICQFAATTEAKLAAAVREAADGTAKLGQISYVLLTSLTTPPANPPLGAQLLCAELKRFTNMGKIAVVAAGNAGNSLLTYPASCPMDQPQRLISVGATDNTGTKLYTLSSRGNWVDVNAPGQEVWTTTIDDPSTAVTERYKQVDGTSYAAPVVTGLAAMLLSMDGVSVDQVKSALTSTLNGNDPSLKLVDALAAVQAVNAAPVASPFASNVDEGGTLRLPLVPSLQNPTAGDGPTVTDANGLEQLYRRDKDGQISGEVVEVEILNQPVFGQLNVDSAGVASYVHDGSEPTGSDSYSFRVFDAAGSPSNEATVTIAIQSLNDPPTVELEMPLEASYPAYGTIEFSVIANDEEGATVVLQWYIDDELQTVDPSSRKLVVTGLAPGTHTIRVEAWDGGGVGLGVMGQLPQMSFEVAPAEQVPLPWGSLLLLAALLLSIRIRAKSRFASSEK